jgi:hypothetical protein
MGLLFDWDMPLFSYYNKAAAKIALKFPITHTLQNPHINNNEPGD